MNLVINAKQLEDRSLAIIPPLRVVALGDEGCISTHGCVCVCTIYKALVTAEALRAKSQSVPVGVSA